MRTIGQITAGITRDVPSARVSGGKHSYASIEVPGTGGVHVTLYLAWPTNKGSALLCPGPDDKGRRITFKRGGKQEDEMIAAAANFLVLHESIRDRRARKEKEKEGSE